MRRDPAALLAGSAVLSAALLGARHGPQRPATAAWYAALRKPAGTPPGPVIGAAWGVLELLLIGSGYRLLRAPHSAARGVALGGWAATLCGLAGYPYLFFGRHRLGSGALAAGAMLAAAGTTVAAAGRVDRPAAAMGVPLLGWLGFATVLSEELWRRNPRLSRD